MFDAGRYKSNRSQMLQSWLDNRQRAPKSLTRYEKSFEKSNSHLHRHYRLRYQRTRIRWTAVIAKIVSQRTNVTRNRGEAVHRLQQVTTITQCWGLASHERKLCAKQIRTGLMTKVLTKVRCVDFFFMPFTDHLPARCPKVSKQVRTHAQ